MKSSSTQSTLDRARYREGGTLQGRLRFFDGRRGSIPHSSSMNSAAPITRKSRGLEADNTTKAATQTSALGNERGFLPHRFNPQIAKIYGLPAAIVFHYIWLRCDRRSGKFITLTVDDIAQRYPYLGRTTIWEALQRLVMPGKNPGIVSRKIINGVYHYGIIPTDKEYVGYKFDVNVATELGIVPAIILASVGHWVKINWKQQAEKALCELYPEVTEHYPTAYKEALVQTARGAAHTTTIEDWVTWHSYLSERTVRRGFLCLLKAGLLEKRTGKQHKTIYTLNVDLMSNYGDKLLSLSMLENSGAKSERRPAKSERIPAKSERISTVSTSEGSTCAAPDEALYDEAFSDQHGDAFAPPSLADARFRLARSASKGKFSLALRAELSQIDQPGYPRRKRRSRKKRRYTRLPKPDDPDFDLYIDDLPPVEREKYLDRFR
jgi:hypothetical protein